MKEKSMKEKSMTQSLTPSPAIDTLIGSALHSLKDERAQAQAAADAERRESEARVQRAFGSLWPEIAPYATPVWKFDSPYQKPLLRCEIQMPGLAPFHADVFARQAEVAVSAQTESGVAVGVSGVKLLPQNDERNPFAEDGPFSDPSRRLAPFFLHLRAAYELAEQRRDFEQRTEQAGLLAESLVKWQQPVARTQEDADRLLAELRTLLPEKEADHHKLYRKWLDLREKERQDAAREAAMQTRQAREEKAEAAYVRAYEAFLARAVNILEDNQEKLAGLQRVCSLPQSCWTLRYALVADDEYGERAVETGDVLVLDGNSNECDQWNVLTSGHPGGTVKKVQYRHVVSVTEREPLEWTQETRFARSIAVPEAKRSLYLSPDTRYDSVTEEELRADIADLGLSPLPEPPKRPAHVSWDDARRLLAALSGRWPQDAGPLPLDGADDSYRNGDDD